MPLFPLPQALIFDCDSTLSTIEGIDELAAAKNCRVEIAALTDRAMNGEVPLEAVYAKRLEIIRPSRSDVRAIADLYAANPCLHAQEIVRHLQDKGVRVGIVSGGLLDAVLPFGQSLGIAEEDIFAVALDYDVQGNYRGVLPSPLTTAAGKFEVVAQWKARHQFKSLYLVGDGMSDVAALGKAAADVVIGYGGVIARPAVREQASIFIEQADLLALLALWEDA